jgi:hypothetical protein
LGDDTSTASLRRSPPAGLAGEHLQESAALRAVGQHQRVAVRARHFHRGPPRHGGVAPAVDLDHHTISVTADANRRCDGPALLQPRARDAVCSAGAANALDEVTVAAMTAIATTRRNWVGIEGA